MNNRQANRAVTMAAAVGLLCAAASPAGLILELGQFQQVSGPEVMLKDIVKDPSTLPETWKERQVMKSPAKPGTPVEYGISVIASALQKYPDMQDVTLRGQMTMSNSRSGPVVGMAKIEKAVRAYIAENKPWKGMKVDIHCDPLSESISIPDEDPVVEVTGFTPQTHQNKYIFATTVSSGNGSKQNISVKTTVTPLIEVWVAKKLISQGQVITTFDNVEAQAMPCDTASAMVPITENISGFEVNSNINPNQPINRHNLVQPVCSQSGDLLNVDVERGGLSVVLRARALSNGRKGERILCMNEQSKRRILVRLTGPREATVDF